MASTNRPTSASLAAGRVRKLSESEAAKLVNSIKSPRVCELESYQSYFDGTAYAGRPSFFTDDVPMQERKPCVQYPLVRLAANSNAAFAMGEGRFPTILSLSSESDDVFDKALGLDKAESAILDSFNAKLVELAWLEKAFREAYKMAQASRSVAMVLGFRSGLPFVDLVWSKLCEPEFDADDPSRVTKLTIRYRYVEQWRDTLITGGEWWPKVLEYLRVIDDVSDTVYAPVEVWDVTDEGVLEGQSPAQNTRKHGFGICPVVWYARNRACSVGSTPDGIAIHEGSRELVEQTDLALSQRHRAAVYTGDPQTVLTGVGEDESVGGSGRMQRPMILAAGDVTGAGRQWATAFAQGSARSGPKLRRGAGEVWRLSNEAASADMLCIPGDALKALDDDGKDLVTKTCDTLGVTIVDPSAFGGAGDLSGRTLAFIFSKQTNRVSEDREDLRRCCILPTLNLFYRMLLTQPDGVYLPGLPKVLPILKRFLRSTEAGKSVWFPPQLKLKWGDYFDPSDVDESTRVQTGLAALAVGAITLKTFVEHVRSVFAIGSVDQYVEQLLKERADKQAEDDAREAKRAQSLQTAMGAMNGGKPAGPKANAALPGAAKPPLPKRGSAGASSKPA